jgi:DNA-binding FadR family transcriptional regulator
MEQNRLDFNFLQYLADTDNAHGHSDPDRIPPLSALSEQLGISIATLREQLQVARTLGFVEVRPRTGIRRLPYSFGPSVSESLSYAVALERSHFDTYAELRQKIEAGFWYQAVDGLTSQDHDLLFELVDTAQSKLNDHLIQLPHTEHRQFHLAIFRRLENPFVFGLLEAYWDAYERVGLNRYERLTYLQKVWSYHHRMVVAISTGEYENGFNTLVEHFDLIDARSAE